MKADLLTVEIGSTITKLNAFGTDCKVAGAIALTTPENIMQGFNRAAADLKQEYDLSIEAVDAIYALSSAAGGLRMSVHGLTRELTARAAEEAARGAGANIQMITAGLIKPHQLDRISALKPNVIMLAGGVEYGEEDIIYKNAEIIARQNSGIPVIYAGNTTLQEEVRTLFKNSTSTLHIADNVYPRFDELNIQPVREIIQNIFSKNLVIAPGIDELKKRISGKIIPVPAACLKSAELLAKQIGDLAVIDLGGATTDVYSVIQTPSQGNLDVQVPSRRTVEGDLGLFVSAKSVWKTMGHKTDPAPIAEIPRTEDEIEISQLLAAKAVELGLIRHAGRLMHGAYLSGGSLSVKGQDLRRVKLMIGTGGGLCRLAGGDTHIRASLKKFHQDSLLPDSDVTIKIDADYIFSACGAILSDQPERALRIILNSIGGFE